MSEVCVGLDAEKLPDHVVKDVVAAHERFVGWLADNPTSSTGTSCWKCGSLMTVADPVGGVTVDVSPFWLLRRADRYAIRTVQRFRCKCGESSSFATYQVRSTLTHEVDEEAMQGMVSSAVSTGVITKWNPEAPIK